MVRTCKIQKETGIQKETAGFMEGIPSFPYLFVRGYGGPIGQELNLLIQSQFSVSFNNYHFSIYILVTILS